jgi:predicted Rossmann fold flavoprotein
MNSKNPHFHSIIVGGGAAGFFTAINSKEKNPNFNIAILEKGQNVLTKVRISGGGRCNLTNACQDVNEFVNNYPRGAKELMGPLKRFGNKETMQWFENRGVSLKTQEDGRVFPQSDQSESIINCFLERANTLNISIFKEQSVKDFQKNKQGIWEIITQDHTFYAENLVITTGSNIKMWQLLEKLGHHIISPSPSLFSFNIIDQNLHLLMGIALPVHVKIKNSNIQSQGNMLITHWGLSGPAILKLSAWGSKILSEEKYHFILIVNWLNDITYHQCLETLKKYRDLFPKRSVFKHPQFGFTHRLWEYIVSTVDISETLNYAEISKLKLENLVKKLTNTEFEVTGKSTFKDEFVTAGGVDLKEINFKTMQSKLIENLYFAGEVIDIDAITGGYNFQNAWTGGWLISEAIVSEPYDKM